MNITRQIARPITRRGGAAQVSIPIFGLCLGLVAACGPDPEGMDLGNSASPLVASSGTDQGQAALEAQAEPKIQPPSGQQGQAEATQPQDQAQSDALAMAREEAGGPQALPQEGDADPSASTVPPPYGRWGRNYGYGRVCWGGYCPNRPTYYPRYYYPYSGYNYWPMYPYYYQRYPYYWPGRF